MRLHWNSRSWSDKWAIDLNMAIRRWIGDEHMREAGIIETSNARPCFSKEHYLCHATIGAD
jgi:hypothetical protein